MTLTPEQRASRGRLWREELDTLHERCVRDAQDHLSSLILALDPTAHFSLPPDAIGLGYTIRDLVSYARTGRAGDWDDSGSAMDALNSVSCLYDATYGDPVMPADWSGEVEHDGARGELAEVAGAVLARVQLEQRRPVPRAWLAALAGVSIKSIVKALSQGELRSAKGSGRAARGDGGGRKSLDVDVESARAWLVAREVEGVS